MRTLRELRAIALSARTQGASRVALTVDQLTAFGDYMGNLETQLRWLTESHYQSPQDQAYLKEQARRFIDPLDDDEL